jgi:plastocyanin
MPLNRCAVLPRHCRIVVLASAILALAWGLSPAAHDHSEHAMTDADMERWVADWYAAHPRHGQASAGAPVDTFSVFAFGFDNDGNQGDGIDTAFVFAGETVLWKFLNGSHTVTNGTGAADPGVGTLFDQPVNVVNQEFPFEFSTAGTVPFFCRPHEGLMSGVVVVSSPTDVIPIGDRSLRAGFLTDPAPNPTAGAASIRFALTRGGRARLEVFDVRGRRVAVVADRRLDAGAYAARWDGRTRHGGRAAAGVYYLRLTVPGTSDSREIVLTR